jgi:hypothetical protein
VQIGKQKLYFWYMGLILAIEGRGEAIAKVAAEGFGVVASPPLTKTNRPL